MVDPHTKARDADRDTAIEVVEGAFADGQISAPDRDLRVERLLQAGTVGEVQMLVRDLQSSEAPAPVEAPPVSRLAPLAPQPPAAASSGWGLKKVVVIVAVVFGIFTVLSVVFPLLVINSVDSFESGGGSGQELELLTAEGYDGWVAAVEERTGSTTVFGATVYPGYAVMDVPVDDDSQRSFGHYYDSGGWSDWSGAGTSRNERFALDQVDGETVEQLVGEVAQLVEDPTTSYVIVNGRDGKDGVCLSAYAMNEYGETALLDATCSGRVVRTYVS